MTPVVLVLDGEQRAALAVVRSLGRQGCEVHVGSHVPESLAGGSRFADSESLLPSPFLGVDAYTAAVGRLARARSANVIIPVGEASTLALLERRDLLPEVSIPTSDLAHFLRASDKSAVLDLAQTLGIDVPGQWTVADGTPAVPPVPAEAFPVVLKPSRSVTGLASERRKVGVRYAHSPRELEGHLSELRSGGDPVLVQSRIEGPGLGIFMLRWRGELVATFAHRRIREKPPAGGVSVCCESVEPSEGLLGRSASLLAALDWSGVAMIEYKHDTRTGRNYLMEVNPRFWGSLQLAIDSGVDFPWYLVQLALGTRIPPVQRWRIGRRSRWGLGDVDHLIARLRYSPAELDLPSDAPGLAQALAAVLLPWRPGQRNEVCRLSDPVPSLRESRAWFRDLWRP